MPKPRLFASASFSGWLMLATLLTGSVQLHAAENPAVITAMTDYLDFADYAGSIIMPQQIPESELKNITFVDARDSAQFGQEHLPGAINIEWRQIVARRNEVPKDHLVVIYCNTGTLSAQAAFMLRMLGWEKVKVLQTGLEGWRKQKGETSLIH